MTRLLREGAAGGALVAGCFFCCLVLFVFLPPSLCLFLVLVCRLLLDVFSLVGMAKVPQPWLVVVMQLLAQTLICLEG